MKTLTENIKNIITAVRGMHTPPKRPKKQEGYGFILGWHLHSVVVSQARFQLYPEVASGSSVQLSGGNCKSTLRDIQENLKKRSVECEIIVNSHLTIDFIHIRPFGGEINGFEYDDSSVFISLQLCYNSRGWCVPRLSAPAHPGFLTLCRNLFFQAVRCKRFESGLGVPPAERAKRS